MNFKQEIIKVAKDLKADADDVAALYFNISDFIITRNIDTKVFNELKNIISTIIDDKQKEIIENVGKELKKNKRFLSILEENNLKSQFVK